ncbi:MAG: hypothetical protein AB8B93_00395 [Pseudomonadales bacterium]
MTRTVGYATKIWLLGLLLASSPSWGTEPVPNTAAPEIGGYSPVSYFTESRAEQGSAEYAVAHQGKVYYLTSPEQMATFAANPDQYQPRFEICPFSLISGKTMAIDPTRFKVVGTSLLLFHQSENVDGLVAWEQAELSDEELLSRAEKQFLLLKF